MNAPRAWGLRTDNPASRIEKYREKPRKRFLSAAEVGQLYAAMEEAERAGSEASAALAAIRLLLLHRRAAERDPVFAVARGRLGALLPSTG